MKAILTLIVLGAGLMHASPWTEAVEKELSALEGSNSTPLIPILRQVFLEDLPHYIEVGYLASGKLKPSQNVYIGDGVISVKSTPGNWSVFFDGSRAFAWREGERTGIVSQTRIDQIIYYVRGVLDPAGLMAGSYERYLEEPKTFHITENKETVVYSWRRSEESDSAGQFLSQFTFFLQKSPLWLSGFRVKSPETDESAEMKVSFPKRVPEIPKELSTPPTDVSFLPGEIPWSRELIPYI